MHAKPVIPEACTADFLKLPASKRVAANLAIATCGAYINVESPKSINAAGDEL